MTISADLKAAYEATDYHVFAAPPFTMKVDQSIAELRALLVSATVQTACFLTACNPRSQLVSDKANEAAMRALASELDHAELAFIDGEGRDTQDDWPGEASYLILGISREKAEALAVQYQQNAYLWIEADGIPRLATTELLA